ncbi:putative signal transducing protein [Eubacterium xylanophilum]|uniref:putative signal transducing protein n=1 Tax=Eubacterium xylanophilum TaxID=39497 RepID=UPI00047A95B1|nr:DUF2007 domain-containing protein [Eubacterium xylanophilum]
MEIVKIYNAQNKMIAEQIKSLLLESGIQSTYSEVGSGQYLNVAQSMSPYGVDIMVQERDAEKASDIIHSIFESNTSANDANATVSDKPRFKDGKFKTRIAVILILLFLLGSYIFAFINQIF